jgi:transcriptional regulator with XRE-family HTH domain
MGKTPEIKPTVVGSNVRKIRERIGMSQTGLAIASARSRGTIAGIELGYSGQRNNLSDTIEAIAKALGVTVADLYAEPKKQPRSRRVA